MLQTGRLPYRDCWDLQRTIFDRCVRGSGPNTLILTEHDPVYTFGTSSDPHHLLASQGELQQLGAIVVQTDRGGDVTFHGPGQLVAYPILSLTDFRTDLHWYLRQLEEVVIRTLAAFGVVGSREPGYTGVWVSGEKICAIGVKTSRWVTMHGLALNVSTDLAFFRRIIPCGIFERGVTSLEQVLAKKLSLAAVAQILVREFGEVFEANMIAFAHCEAGVIGESIERTTA